MSYRWMEHLPTGEDFDEMTANLISLEMWKYLAKHGGSKYDWRHYIPYEANCALCSFYRAYDGNCDGCCLYDVKLCCGGIGEAYTYWSANVDSTFVSTDIRNEVKARAKIIADAIETKCKMEGWV